MARPESTPRSDPEPDAEAAPPSFSLVRTPCWWISFVLLFGLACVWVFSSPLFSVPDEPAHVVKAAAVVRGQLGGDKLEVDDQGEGLFRGGFTIVVDVPASYTFNTSELPNCYIYDERVPAGCAPVFEDDARTARWTTWVGRYPPPAYAVVGLPSLVDTGTGGIYAMRILGAAICAAFLATALTLSLAARRFAWVGVGVLVAATPELFFLAGSVNPSGIEAAAAICLWVSLGVLLLDRRPGAPGAVLAAVVVSGGVLAVTRPVSTLWVATIAVALLAFTADRARVRELLRLTRVRVSAAVVGVLCVAGVLWSFGADALGNQRGDDPRGLGYLDAWWHSVGRIPRYLRELTAVFGWRSTPSPELLYWAWGIAALVLVGTALWVGTRRLRIGVVVLAAAALLGPAFLEAIRASSDGFTWQGRYGLPLAAGVPVLAAFAIGTGRALSSAVVRRVAGTVTVLVVTVQVAAHVVSTRRYVAGSEGPWFYLGEHGWEPPIPTWLLLLVAVVCTAGLGVLAYLLVTTERADAPDEPAVVRATGTSDS